jgi:hypothetical protein
MYFHEIDVEPTQPTIWAHIHYRSSKEQQSKEGEEEYDVAENLHGEQRNLEGLTMGFPMMWMEDIPQQL